MIKLMYVVHAAVFLLIGCGGISGLALGADAGVSPQTQYILNNLLLFFSAALVMWMAAGFCMLESGIVRAKSTAIVCLKNLMLYAVACLAYFIVGYNLMFADFGIFVSPELFELGLLSSPENAEHLAHATKSGMFSMTIVFFQMVFVATAASIVSGSLAERVRLWSFLIFVFILAAFVYPIVGEWTWGGGWLDEMGFKDFAGSTIVHSVGGWAALAGILLIGPRTGKFKPDGTVVPTPASNVPIATLGTFILWLGWLGFNGGSQLALGGVADAAAVGLIFFNTNIAAVGGVITAMVLGVVIHNRVQVLWILNGAISGLVAITAGPDITNPVYALLIGAIGGLVATLSVPLFEKFKIDDVVGAIPAHLVAGIWGTLAVGIFSDDAKVTVLTQLIGIAAIGGFVFVCSLVVWAILKYTLGLRVSKDSEFLGQDIMELGIEAYPEFLSLEGIQSDAEGSDKS